MNPYRDQNPTFLPGSPWISPPGLHSSHPQTSVQPATVLHQVQTSSNQNPNQVPSSSETGLESETPNVGPVPTYQVSVIIPPGSEDHPDLECSICFCSFNNVYRCPKMLQCRHTFCLECLTRINIKSAEPSAVQCPLCRSLTALPALGPPKLSTDTDVLSCLPAAMQRVYSIRFLRRQGKLQVKRSSWGQHSMPSLRLANRSLDVGVPSPTVREGSGSVGEAVFRLTARPVCRAFLLTAVVMMMVLLLGVIIFAFKQN